MLKYVFSLSLLFVGHSLFGQCTIEFIDNNDTIYTCAGSLLVLNTSVYIPIASEDFSNVNNPLWDSVSYGIYTDPCGTNPNSLNSPYHWFDTNSFNDSIRLLSTIPLDLNYFSVEVCFDLKMGQQGGGFPCEGPDGFDEGVSLKYSIDNGVTWVDIIYMAPTGLFLDSVPDTNLPNLGLNPTIFSVWDQYCFDLPSQALTSSSKLKWEQFNNSCVQCDAWGIDNVFIRAQSSNYSYAWNLQSSNYDSLSYTPSNDTLATVFYTDGVSDTCMADVYINANYVLKDTTLYDTICAGQSFALNTGTLINTVGVYQDTISGLNCDSLFTRNLWVAPIPYTSFSVIYFCDSIFYGGNYVVYPGTYSDTLIDANGCLYRESALLIPNGNPVYTQSSISFCSSISIGGVTYTSNQQLVDTFVASNNCDSIHTTMLVQQNNSFNSQDSITFCNSIQFGGILYSSSQHLVDTFATATGCDSLHTTFLVKQIGGVNTQNAFNFCDSILVNGVMLTSSQQFVDTYNVTGGCDSIHTSSFVKRTSFFTQLPDIFFCDSTLFGGIWYFSSSTVTTSLTSSFGCDSILNQNLILDNSISGKLTTSAGADLSNSKVYLIEYLAAQDSIYMVDSTVTSFTGNYTFQNIMANNYIKAIPDLSSYPNEIPTYYNTSAVFQFAQSAYCNIYDFATISGVNPGGSGFISGLVGNGAGKNNELGEAIEGIDVILTNNDQVVAVNKTNQDGYFEFDNLACTIFEIWIDDLRVDNLIAPEIDLSSGSCNEDSLIFVLDETGLKMEIPTGLNILNIENALKLIPNPANQQVRLVIDENVNIQRVVILDVFGRVVENKNISAKELNIETKARSTGLYKVVFYGKDNEFLGSKSLIIQH